MIPGIPSSDDRCHRLPFRDRGVSTVVGAAILIGIVVVLATLVGSYALMFSPDDQQQPSSKIHVSQDLVDRGPTPHYVDNKPAGVDYTEGVNDSVLQISVEHLGGEQLDQQTIHTRIRAEAENDTVAGHLVGWNDTEEYNLTEPRWNSGQSSPITVGSIARYELFVTDRIGLDDNARVDGVPIRNLWRHGKCSIERFGDHRNGNGPVVIGDANSAGVTTGGAACPVEGDYDTGAVISPGEIEEGGRIAGGDVVRVEWEPPGAQSSALLESFEVYEPQS